MGIFSRIFGVSSDIEKQLEQFYVPMFQTMMGVSLSEAKSVFHNLLKQAKEESIKEDTSNLPEYFGNFLLEREVSDEKIAKMLSKKRRRQRRGYKMVVEYA